LELEANVIVIENYIQALKIDVDAKQLAMQQALNNANVAK